MIDHIDETDQAFALLARVLVAAVEDYRTLLRLGLVVGRTICERKWPMGVINRRMAPVMVWDRISHADATATMTFLFGGDAERLFRWVGLEVDVPAVVGQIMERMDAEAEGQA